MLHEWSAALLEERVFFQLFALDGAVYVWIGGDDSRFDSLGVGVPAAELGRSLPTMPSATMLLGGREGDAGSQLLAQRLSRRLGMPTFVSLNLREDPQLRLFAEKEVLRVLSESLTARMMATSTVPARSVPAPEVEQGQATPRAEVFTPSNGDSNLSATFGGDGPARGSRTHEVFNVIDKLAERASELLLEAAKTAIARSGIFIVALSGGSIPKLLAPKLLAAGERAQLDCWRFFLADERCAHESPDQTNPQHSCNKPRAALIRKRMLPLTLCDLLICQAQK
eukprot:scaffold46618_cov31-Tisochrysis_lutea.AAC.2